MRYRGFVSMSIFSTLALACVGRSPVIDDDGDAPVSTSGTSDDGGNDNGVGTNVDGTFDDGGLDDGGLDDGPDIPDTCEVLELAVTSECIVGEEITSMDFAHAACEAEFGKGWSWLEFHATWGWSVQAQTHPEAWSTESRAWVWVDDQDSECFSSPERMITPGQLEHFGMTWQPIEGSDGCTAATCNDPTGLDVPGLDPLENDEQLQCNPYEGDTPCSLCRPLLCIRAI